MAAPGAQQRPTLRKSEELFFQLKNFTYDLEVILLHAKAFFIVEIPNINPYFIAFGRSFLSLSATKPQTQSKAMFFVNFIFAP